MPTVVTHVQINVFDLFVHDEWSVGALSGWSVARAIEDAIQRSEPDSYDAEGNLLAWEVKSPEETGLDRFTLWRGGKQVVEGRLCSEDGVRSAFPARIVAILEDLERGDFVLDEVGLSPEKPERRAGRSHPRARPTPQGSAPTG